MAFAFPILPPSQLFYSGPSLTFGFEPLEVRPE